MSIKSNLQASLADQKSRIFLFLMLGIIIIVSFVAYFSRKSSVVSEQNASAGINPGSAVVNPSAALDPIPGLKATSAEYQALKDKNYKEISNKALNQQGMPVAALPSLQQGGNSLSAIPGLVDNNTNHNDLKNFDKSLLQQQDLQNQLLKSQQDQLNQKQMEAANKKAQELMGRQTQVLAQGWQVAQQQYVRGANISYPKAAHDPFGDHTDNINSDNKPKIYYKAGDILFGVTITAVNSDEPGPILARIVSGPLSDAKIIGSINAASIPQTALTPKVSQSLILEFNLLNIPGKKISVPVKAVAIDPETARTGLATSVDNHYILRYGTFFASNFLSGLGQAVGMQNQAKVITLSGTADVGSDKSFTGKQESQIAVGKTAEALSQALNILSIPPTIKIASGTAIGILLQNDIVISGDNTQALINRTYDPAASLQPPGGIPTTPPAPVATGSVPATASNSNGNVYQDTIYKFNNMTSGASNRK